MWLPCLSNIPSLLRDVVQKKLTPEDQAVRKERCAMLRGNAEHSNTLLRNKIQQ